MRAESRSITTRRALLLIGSVVFCLALDSCPRELAAGSSGAHLEIVPLSVLQGDSVSLRIRDLSPGDVATVHAQSVSLEDGRIQPFYAAATFMADEEGKVDLAKTAPVRGDYDRPDIRGLFWSQHRLDPASPDRETITALHLDEPTSITVGQAVLALEVRGTIIDRKVVNFLPGDPANVREEIQSDGLVGAFYYRKGARKLPLLIILGSSEGGLADADWFGPKLASRGFVVFGLNYFSPPPKNVSGVPTALRRIPIESIEKIRTWAEKRPEADINRIGMIGYSKGAEFTLVGASTYDWIRAAVAYAPSDVVWQGIQPGGGEAASSWMLAGKELPYLHTTGVRDEIAKAQQSGGRVSLAHVLRANFDAASTEALAAAAIPVERSHAAFLLIGGGDDQVIDSGACVARLAARLRRASYRHFSEILMYPGAGHVLIGTGWRPTTINNTDFIQDGGTPKADAEAQAESWTKMLAFLSHELRR